MLEARSLEKSYGSLRAVGGVSLSVAKGESVGLLGPNGAGKTTTISMLTGLVRPDRGQVLIEGRAIESDLDPAKQKLGLVPQELALYDELSAEQNLRTFGALYGCAGRRSPRRSTPRWTSSSSATAARAPSRTSAAA